jgi:glycosyltransferase involved in cell wall biosynthesis
LAKQDIDIVLATMGPRPTGAQRDAIAMLPNVQLMESDFRLEWMSDPWSDVHAAGDWLLAIAARTQVDVVHINGFAHAALPWRRPVVCVAHSCVYSWWHAVHGCAPPAEWDTYRSHVIAGVANADRVVAPTAAFLEQLRACYEFSSRCEVIQNADGRSTSSAYALVTRLPVILACGRPWDAAKNIMLLDTAVTDLSAEYDRIGQQGPRWRSYVIGPTQEPDGQEYSPSALRALGALSARGVDEWLRRASIFVHPAVYEPFGLAVLEAARAGCALVLADIPTMRELWNGAAEFFDPRDGADLRRVLELLISQPRKRQRLADAALERANCYRADVMAEAYARLYRTLVAEHARAAQAAA